MDLSPSHTRSGRIYHPDNIPLDPQVVPAVDQAQDALANAIPIFQSAREAYNRVRGPVEAFDRWSGYADSGAPGVQGIPAILRGEVTPNRPPTGQLERPAVAEHSRRRPAEVGEGPSAVRRRLEDDLNRLEQGQPMADDPPALEGPYPTQAPANASGSVHRAGGASSANLPGGGGITLPAPPIDCTQLTTRVYTTKKQLTFCNDSGIQKWIKPATGNTGQFQGGWHVVPDNQIGFYLPPEGVSDFEDTVNQFFRVKKAEWVIYGAKYRYITEQNPATAKITYNSQNASFPDILIHTNPNEAFTESSLSSALPYQDNARKTFSGEYYLGAGNLATAAIPDTVTLFADFCRDLHTGRPVAMPFYLGRGVLNGNMIIPLRTGALGAAGNNVQLQVADPFFQCCEEKNVNDLVGWSRSVDPVPGWQPIHINEDAIRSRLGRPFDAQGFTQNEFVKSFTFATTKRVNNKGRGDQEDYATIAAWPLRNDKSVINQFRQNPDLYMPHIKHHHEPTKFRVKEESPLPDGNVIRVEITLMIATHIELEFKRGGVLWNSLLPTNNVFNAQITQMPFICRNTSNDADSTQVMEFSNAFATTVEEDE